MLTAPLVAVYGAAGYTGRRVAAELRARGFGVVLSGRDPESLAGVGAVLGDNVEVRAAAVDDARALGRAIHGCAAVVNCAGPFATTGEKLVAAAIAARCHYVDTTAEQAFMKILFERYDAPAADAGVAVVPAMGFYYALGDMLAHLVADRQGALEDVTIAYGVRGWRLTPGSRLTALGFTKGRTVYESGAWRPASSRVAFASFGFPPPRGRERMIHFPAGEVLTVPRHVRTHRVTTFLSARAFPKLSLSSALPLLATIVPEPRLARVGPLLSALARALPDRTTAAERARSDFTIVVVATTAEGRERRGVACGVDIYGLSASTTAESVERILEPSFDRVGVLAPSEAFDPRSFLDSLRRAPAGITFRVDAASAERECG